MVRINFIVEGSTEEAFVRNLLVPYLSAFGVYAFPRSIETGRHGAKIFKGGMTNYEKAKQDILRWAKQEPKSYLTTMFDFYGLPDDFPGMEESKKIADPYKKVRILQKALKEDISIENFIPYIQLHEFEGLLFSNIEKIDHCMELWEQHGQTDRLKKIIDKFETPEHINNSRETAPSKRLLNIYSAYDKVFLGSLISDQIGLSEIQEKCLHFSRWIEKLSKLSKDTSEL